MDTQSATTSTSTNFTSSVPIELGNLNSNSINEEEDGEEDGQLETEYQRFNELGDEYEPSEDWLTSLRDNEEEKGVESKNNSKRFNIADRDALLNDSLL